MAREKRKRREREEKKERERNKKKSKIKCIINIKICFLCVQLIFFAFVVVVVGSLSNYAMKPAVYFENGITPYCDARRLC